MPRIVEIETCLRDNLNADKVAETVVGSWARQLGEQVQLSDPDIAITNCLDGARVLRIHTLGDGVFEKVGRTYPDGQHSAITVPVSPCGEPLGVACIGS